MTLTDRDAAAKSVVPVLTGTDVRSPIELPALPLIRPAELRPEEWAEGITAEGTIELNDLQQELIALAQRIDAERAPAAPAGAEPAPEPAPEPTFRSEAELGEYIEAFRRRHLDQI